MPKALTVQFQGICAFLKPPGGKILVVLPETGGDVPRRVAKPHRAFLRWERADEDPTSTLKADKKESDRTYGVAVLQNETLSIAGPVQRGPLVVKQTFLDQVPPMDQRSKSRPQTSSRIAARITIDSGTVEAEPTEPGHKWVFKPLGSRVTASERKDAAEYSNNVLWKLNLQQGSKTPVRIVTGQGDLVIKPSAAGVVQITIGNLENLLPVVSSKRRPQDVDFLFQYEIAEKPLPIKQRPIPTRITRRGTKGARVECFAARWGNFTVGVQ